MAEPRKVFTVMIAIDTSQQAEYAFDYYVTNLHRPDNQVYLVHVPENMTTVTAVKKHYRLGIDEWEKMMETERVETDALVAKYDDRLHKSQIPGTHKTFYGKPGEALCEAAQELKADMVVMGTRGLGSVRRTILGSVSDFVIHHASVPVVVCKQ